MVTWKEGILSWLMTAGLVLVAATITPYSSAYADDPHPLLKIPGDEQFRSAIQGVLRSQASRPPAVLEQRVHETLRSIRESEGQIHPTLGDLLSSRLRATWAELERSRQVGGLGYPEFDTETFQTAEATFQEILTQFVGTRTLYPGESYQAALRSFDDVQMLSRNARRAVPGLTSDDVLIMREKRQKLMKEEPKQDEGFKIR